jgi:hypothetical protein
MPGHVLGRGEVGWAVALAAALAAGPLWAQSAPKSTPKKELAAASPQPAPQPGAQPTTPSQPGGRSHYPWVPEGIRQKSDPFTVDLALFCGGAVLMGLLFILSAWIPAKRPDDPLEGLTLAQMKKLDGVIGSGEEVLWVSAGSDRIRRRDAGLAIMIFGTLTAAMVALGQDGGWNPKRTVITIGLAGGTLALVVHVFTSKVLCALTDTRAYVLYSVPRGDFLFTYSHGELTRPGVQRAWLVPGAGKVVFGGLQNPGADGGPGGFPNVDDVQHVCELVQRVAAAIAAPRPAVTVPTYRPPV